MKGQATNPSTLEYATEAEVRTLVRRFEACELTRAEWNHRAHLTVAMWYLTHYRKQRAIDLMIERIQAFNHAMGIVESRRGGFHETLTRFWSAEARGRWVAPDIGSLDDVAAALFGTPTGPP